jgi:hypothetical protein
LGQIRRWLPNRTLIVVADSSYAALELLAWCTQHTLTVMTRLRLAAALYAAAPACRPGQPGRRRLKGERLKKLIERLTDPRTPWQTVQLAWYGQPERRLPVATGTAVWYHSGKPPVAIRWVLVRDPKGRCEPMGLLSTDLSLEARQIVLYYMRRWSMESTFQAARLCLGIDGQRQWQDLAVSRTTPVRLGLFSLVALMVQRQPAWQGLFRCSAWEKKAWPTFADGLAHVRRALWAQLGFWLSQRAGDEQKTPQLLCDHVAELLAYFT